MRRPLVLTLAAVFHLIAPAGVQADEFPGKPLRFVVGYPAGGSTDVAARAIGQRLTQTLGWQAVVENRAGAAGSIAAQAVARAPADGYTLFFAASPEMAINRLTMKNPGYDPDADFVPITLVGRTAFVLVAHPDLPVKSVADLVRLAREKPGQLNFASFGSGTSNHLVGEMFKLATGTDIVHVPYKGSAPAITDLMGGTVQLMFDTIAVATPHIKGGRLRAIAVATEERFPLLPEVPTLDESGVSRFTGGSWIGVLAPRGTPPAVVGRLHREIVAVIKVDPIATQFRNMGIGVVGGTPDEFRAFIAEETERFGRAVRAASITPQ